MNIVYVLDDLDAAGGIQAVTRAKAAALAALPGNEVTLVAANDARPGAAPPPPGVRAVHLGVNYYEDDWKGFLYVLKGILVKRRRHARALRRALDALDPDIVVSVGQAEKFMLPRLARCKRWKTVREYHYARTYRRDYARLDGSLRARAVAAVSDWYENALRRARYDATVVLTRLDRDANWHGRADVQVIPNLCVYETEAVSSLDRPVAVAVGRLVPFKGFDMLIRAWATVAAAHPDWRLDIWGDGPERARLEQLIAALGLAGMVVLRGASAQVQSEMARASLLAFSSHFEGFGMVMVEAMNCGVPCAAFACPCGPPDIIDHEVNGLLAPAGDVAALAAAMLRLIENPDERRKLGAAARRKAAHYSAAAVIPQWMKLFRTLVNSPAR